MSEVSITARTCGTNLYCGFFHNRCFFVLTELLRCWVLSNNIHTKQLNAPRPTQLCYTDLSEFSNKRTLLGRERGGPEGVEDVKCSRVN